MGNVTVYVKCVPYSVQTLYELLYCTYLLRYTCIPLQATVIMSVFSAILSPFLWDLLHGFVEQTV